MLEKTSGLIKEYGVNPTPKGAAGVVADIKDLLAAMEIEMAALQGVLVYYQKIADTDVPLTKSDPDVPSERRSVPRRTKRHSELMGIGAAPSAAAQETEAKAAFETTLHGADKPYADEAALQREIRNSFYDGMDAQRIATDYPTGRGDPLKSGQPL